MKKNIISIALVATLLTVTSCLHAAPLANSNEPIFAKVVNVSEGDVLNIRIKPNHKANKVGEASQGALLGVNYCVKSKTSTWCNVTTLNYANNVVKGWVNASFLNLEGKHTNKGYIKVIDRTNSCYYSIKCKEINGQYMCLIANSNFSSITPTTEWIPRRKLQAGTAFDSAPKHSDGYCINGREVENHFSKD